MHPLDLPDPVVTQRLPVLALLPERVLVVQGRDRQVRPERHKIVPNCWYVALLFAVPFNFVLTLKNLNYIYFH
jgi:hypothetical protein